jgi:CcmD family protein
MFKFFLRLFFLGFLSILTVITFGQDSLKKEKPQMADGMRSNGKIYVVVTVLVIILSGLFIYLTRIDRKLKRMESQGK